MCDSANEVDLGTQKHGCCKLDLEGTSLEVAVVASRCCVTLTLS